MSYLVVLIPVALLMGAVGLAAFLWSLRAGQYHDLDGAAARILVNDGDGVSDVEGLTSHKERQRYKGVSQVGS
ncbi:hypothetical protein BLJAPNOD_05546 [Ensifer sp. M14]|nr:cbb3-type cytochrome oxidase assembly protein CcoS [Ensifer sp. M14]RDL47622.1 hypothetical protein BLJAPNOD_05546 [Ensifer sp. M14]